MRLGLGLGFSAAGDSIAAQFAAIAGRVLDIDFTRASNLTNGSDVAPSNGDAIKTALNSVSGVAFSQATVGARPTFIVPGGGASSYAQFTSASQTRLRSTEAALVNAFKDFGAMSLFVLAQQGVTSGVKVLAAIDVLGSQPYRILFQNNTTLNWEQRNDASGTDNQFIVSTASAVDTTRHIYAVVDSSGTSTLYRDGSALTLGSGSASYTVAAPQTVTGVTIGSWEGAALTTSNDGKIYRVLGFSRALSASERSIVNTYLASLP